jgi:hypothetical protein
LKSDLKINFPVRSSGWAAAAIGNRRTLDGNATRAARGALPPPDPDTSALTKANFCLSCCVEKIPAQARRLAAGAIFLCK